MRFGKLVSPLILTLAFVTAVRAQAALRAAPSTRATAEVTLSYPEGQGPAGAKPMVIRIDYGQPHLRGRMVNTDSLVPFDKPWRLGANAATRLVTEADLVIGGATLPKGTYVLFTMPSRAGWKLIIQKNGPEPEVTYDAKNDIASVDLRVRAVNEPVESLTMALIPAAGSSPARGELRIAWGTFVLATDWKVQ